MLSLLRKCISLCLVFAVALIAPVPGLTDHVVSRSDLQKAVEESTQLRAANVEKVKQFLSSEIATEAIKQAQADPVKVMNAVPLLSDDELSSLAISAEQAQSSFAGGYHAHDVVTILIVIVLVVAIVILVREVD